jgi:hypothetical protein
MVVWGVAHEENTHALQTFVLADQEMLPELTSVAQSYDCAKFATAVTNRIDGPQLMEQIDRWCSRASS